MTYESWRISYQSSEAAALAAYTELTALREQMAAIGAGGVEPLRKQAAAPQAAVPETREALVKRLIADVQVADTIATSACQRVAELPDRASPADWPESMLVTGDELHMIVREAVIEAQSAPAHPAEGLPVQAAVPVGWMNADTLRAMQDTPKSEKTRWPLYNLSELHSKSDMVPVYAATLPTQQGLLGQRVATLWVEESGVLDFEVLPPCKLPAGEYPLHIAAQAKQGGV